MSIWQKDKKRVTMEAGSGICKDLPIGKRWPIHWEADPWDSADYVCFVNYLLRRATL